MSDLSNGSSAPPPAGEAKRMAVINTQYVKDLSFENPRSPHSLVQQETPPEVQVKVDVKAQNLGPDVFEVVMIIRAEAKQGEEIVFLAELSYGAVVSLLNTLPEDVPPSLMIETPRLMFPFVRNILADVTRDGGFAPLLLGPIDFADMYRQRAATQQPATGTVSV